MKKMLAFVYGVCGFLLFNAALIYFILFISPKFGPHTTVLAMAATP